MTITSLRLLAHFVNTYHPDGRVADYGGTAKIGSEIVERMLTLDNISVIDASKKGEFKVVLDGSINMREFEYNVLDYDNGVDLLKPIRGRKFDYGITMDLLEHVSQPFVVAENIQNSLKKDALLFVTVPWVWEIHDYPDDYWRFTPQGLQELFSRMECITVEIIRDMSEEEELPRQRLAGIFRKR